MKTYTYESILRAVGQVLDDADARGFSIHDDDDGLVVETRDITGRPEMTLRFGLSDLVELLDRKGIVDAQPRMERKYNEGTLADFLARHQLTRRELVGAHR